MRYLFLCLPFILATGLSAQSLEITSVAVAGDSVEIVVETTMLPPFEVMVGLSLAGQDPEDVFIGTSVRLTVTGSGQILTVPAQRRGEPLPAGDYLAEVGFYPRWGAKSSSGPTRLVTEVLHARAPVTLGGAREAAGDVARRDALQRWVMLNVAAGDRFDRARLTERLGASEETGVSNRNAAIRAHYFAEADMTLFENALTGRLVTWKLGRADSL